MNIIGIPENIGIDLKFYVFRRLLDSDKPEAEAYARESGIPESEIQKALDVKTPATPTSLINSKEFDEYTALGKLRANVYWNGRSIVISNNKTEEYEEEVSLEYKQGNIYKRVYRLTYNNEESDTTTLIASLGLIIKNAYIESGKPYLVYLMPFDKQDNIVDFDTAIDRIGSTARLNTGQMHFLWRLMVGISNDFIQLGERNFKENGIYISSDKVKVVFSDSIDPKDTLEKLKKLYEETDEGMKPILSNCLLYSSFIPLNEAFRNKDYIVPALLIHGKAGDGKSSIARFCTVRGYGNRFLDKTEQDVVTAASMRENFSVTNLPILIDEISEKTMRSHLGYLKSALSGTGSASRGRKSGGNIYWHSRTIPIYTSNESISIDSGMNRRLFKMHSLSTGSRNISKWIEIRNSIPEGFLYTILKGLDGKNIDEIIKETLSNVHSDEDIIYAYLEYMEKYFRNLYSSYGLESPFKCFRIREQDEQDIYDAFVDYFISANQLDPKTKIKLDVDYFIVEEEGKTYYYITSKGYGIFRRDYPIAPAYMQTFVDNAPQSEEIHFDYVSKRLNKHLQRVISLSLRSISKVVFTEENKGLEVFNRKTN